MKTRDGIRIDQVTRIGRSLGADIKEGTKHALLMTYTGMRPCPVAESTDAKRMVVPWLREATGYKFTNTELYSAMRRGYI